MQNWPKFKEVAYLNRMDAELFIYFPRDPGQNIYFKVFDGRDIYLKKTAPPQEWTLGLCGIFSSWDNKIC